MSRGWWKRSCRGKSKVQSPGVTWNEGIKGEDEAQEKVVSNWMQKMERVVERKLERKREWQKPRNRWKEKKKQERVIVKNAKNLAL